MQKYEIKGKFYLNSHYTIFKIISIEIVKCISHYNLII